MSAFRQQPDKGFTSPSHILFSVASLSLRQKHREILKRNISQRSDSLSPGLDNAPSLRSRLHEKGDSGDDVDGEDDTGGGEGEGPRVSDEESALSERAMQRARLVFVKCPLAK